MINGGLKGDKYRNRALRRLMKFENSVEDACVRELC